MDVQVKQVEYGQNRFIVYFCTVAKNPDAMTGYSYQDYFKHTVGVEYYVHNLKALQINYSESSRDSLIIIIVKL